MKKRIALIIALLCLLLFMYFQLKHYNSKLKPIISEKISNIIKKFNVQSPAYSIDYLTVSLSGNVLSHEQRSRISEQIKNIRGVRFPEKNNQLQVQGWLFYERKKDTIHIAGSHPKDKPSPWKIAPLLHHYTIQSAALKTTPNTLSAYDNNTHLWSKFLELYYTPPGDRSIELKNQTLSLKGAATKKLREQWLTATKHLPFIKKTNVNFTLYPSIYHIPGYILKSKITQEEYEKISAVLQENQIHFDSGSAEISPSELPKIENIITAMGIASTQVTYVLGGHADATGSAQANQILALKRAESVQEKILAALSSTSTLEVVSFGSTKSSGTNSNDRRVEILIK